MGGGWGIRGPLGAGAGAGAAAAKVARAKKKMAVLTNMTKEIGFVGIMEVTGCGKAPGLGMEDWSWR